MNLSTLGCSRHLMTFTWWGADRLGLGLCPSLFLSPLPRQRPPLVPKVEESLPVQPTPHPLATVLSA